MSSVEGPQSCHVALVNACPYSLIYLAPTLWESSTDLQGGNEYHNDKSSDAAVPTF